MIESKYIKGSGLNQIGHTFISTLFGTSTYGMNDKKKQKKYTQFHA